MKVDVTVTFDVTPALSRTVSEFLGHMSRPRNLTPAIELTEPQPEKPAAESPRAASVAKPDPAPVPEPSAQPETQSEPAPEAQPQPEYEEKPEDVLPLLRERFGIPKTKEDRTEEDQARAKALNKAVITVIREVTKNNNAKSISDLRTEDDRQEFIRLALLIAYDTNTGQFEVKAF